MSVSVASLCLLISSHLDSTTPIMLMIIPAAVGLLALGSSVAARPITARDAKVNLLSTVGYGDLVFDLDGIPYLSSTTAPSAQGSGSNLEGMVPITVFKFEECSITADALEAKIASYLEMDDVISEAFLQAVYISSTCDGASLDDSAMSYLNSMGAATVFLSPTCSSTGQITVSGLDELEPGPYIASQSVDGTASFSLVYRLYVDRYRTFIFGAYPDVQSPGSYKPFPVNIAAYQDPLIPVPSRLYSLSSDLPFAGLRVSIKDLYDIAGLQTSGGSRAWAEITPIANTTAPVIQRIIDLGGHIVGKQKTAQFASGADPWDWYDVQYPFNPRGDEWLTCSASSSGGGCSIAAYDWLDHAIGSDTGSSVRRPAAVSGTYGNRPSQGMISLEGVQPLGAAQDTAGVFARDPHAFAYFARHWYTPSLHQDPSLNGLEALNLPTSAPLPSTVIYDPQYLPIRNPAANALVQNFYASLTTTLGMTKLTTNLTSAILSHPNPTIANVSYLNNASSLANQYTQWHAVGLPLLTAWSSLYSGRFPPIDPARRPGWIARTQANTTAADYDAALAYKRTYSDWFNGEVLGLKYNHTSETSASSATGPSTCANSALWIYDVGTGGLPSYREEDLLVDNEFATRLNYTPPDTVTNGVGFCSFAGCADFTVPIGQVPYFSNVTQTEEMVPVTLSLVMRRGCDWSLFALIEKLADVGVLRGVKTGRTAF
jgi:Asp-tRNA(Asn)/Glu-tRNA(Gln) amidotransferase A subunit family amidase